MNAHTHPVAVVIGIGNVFRRDDGVGEVAASRLRAALPDQVDGRVQVHSVDGEPSRIVDIWDGVELAVIIDAVASGDEPGVVHHVELDPLVDSEAAQLLAVRRTNTSTHGAGVAEAIGLGMVLDRVPRRLVVYGVEGHDFGEGVGLSVAVEAAVDRLVDHVVREVSPP